MNIYTNINLFFANKHNLTICIKDTKAGSISFVPHLISVEKSETNKKNVESWGIHGQLYLDLDDSERTPFKFGSDFSESEYIRKQCDIETNIGAIVYKKVLNYSAKMARMELDVDGDFTQELDMERLFMSNLWLVHGKKRTFAGRDQDVKDITNIVKSILNQESEICREWICKLEVLNNKMLLKQFGAEKKDYTKQKI